MRASSPRFSVDRPALVIPSVSHGVVPFPGSCSWFIQSCFVIEVHACATATGASRVSWVLDYGLRLCVFDL